jgi:hypothetical protein
MKISPFFEMVPRGDLLFRVPKNLELTTSVMQN